MNLRCWNGSAVSHNSNKLQLSLSENSQTLFFKKAFSIFAWNLNKAILRRIRLYEHTNVHFVFIHETVPTLSVSLAAMKEQKRYTLSPPRRPWKTQRDFLHSLAFWKRGKKAGCPFPLHGRTHLGVLTFKRRDTQQALSHLHLPNLHTVPFSLERTHKDKKKNLTFAYATWEKKYLTKPHFYLNREKLMSNPAPFCEPKIRKRTTRTPGHPKTR